MKRTEDEYKQLLAPVPLADAKAGKNEDILWILNRFFFSVIQVDLLENTAYIMQSVDFPERIGQAFSWDEYLNAYQRFMRVEEFSDFRSDSLLEKYHSGQKKFSKEIAYSDEESDEWLTMDAFLDEKEGKPVAAVSVRKSSGDHLLKRIIDLYVYNTCDYFIYLDAKNNSYTMFSGSTDGTPLPPAICQDYATELVKYARDYVVPEDQEKVIYEMGIDRVLEQLEKKKVHSFSCGIEDPVRGYTRKRLKYQYYDKKNQMILLSRTDITDAYFEGKEKQKELLEALKRARSDSLTGVLNHQGIIEEISEYLKEGAERAALVVIDLDDFKNVNDSFGHMEGDHLLCMVADALTEETETDGIVGRIGGDEFLIFLRNADQAENVKKRIQRICHRIHRISGEIGFEISCSIGAAVSPEEGRDFETLMKLADSRVYQAKASGKNMVFM